MTRMGISLLTIFLCLSTSAAFSKEPDWSVYAELLSKHVTPGAKNGVSLTRVDYEAVQSDPIYPKVLRVVESFSINQLANKHEKMAFYINAYNIYAIKMVVDHLPLKSIKDVGSFFSPVWKKKVGMLGGKEFSLDEIEHEILRPMNDPRIHAAIVCASVSCPDLKNEPYNGHSLSDQLDEQVVMFLNNSSKGLIVKGSHLYPSKIFDWFEDDFDSSGGVKQFILHYRNDLSPHVQIESYLPYDWQLNAK